MHECQGCGARYDDEPTICIECAGAEFVELPDTSTPAERWWDENEDRVMEGIAVGDLDPRGRPW